MKNVILENGFLRDVPKELLRWLERNNILEYELVDTRQIFWKENVKNTFKKFMSYEDGTNFYTHHVFEDFQLLELFTELFYEINDKTFNFHIMNNSMVEYLQDFLKQDRADITPNELQRFFDISPTLEDSNIIWNQILEFKKEIVRKFENVLQKHNFIWILPYGNKSVIFKSLEEIKNFNL